MLITGFIDCNYFVNGNFMRLVIYVDIIYDILLCMLI